MTKTTKVRLGAYLSDLTASLWALATEEEAGHALEQRKMEIFAQLRSIKKLVEEFEHV